MSTETAVLLALKELHSEVASTRRQIDIIAARVAPVSDQLSTREAMAYARVADSTLYRWRDAGLLSYRLGPRPWNREELDRVLRGSPARRRGAA